MPWWNPNLLLKIYLPTKRTFLSLMSGKCSEFNEQLKVIKQWYYILFRQTTFAFFWLIADLPSIITMVTYQQLFIWMPIWYVLIIPFLNLKFCAKLSWRCNIVWKVWFCCARYLLVLKLIIAQVTIGLIYGLILVCCILYLVKHGECVIGKC